MATQPSPRAHMKYVVYYSNSKLSRTSSSVYILHPIAYFGKPTETMMHFILKRLCCPAAKNSQAKERSVTFFLVGVTGVEEALGVST